ncbi:hypothetical protein MF406_01940 [Georgenia sp. TF02-10]|uniref:hypothetical protein n=1 Tax=Georgenia sp. TF02-10 TaxID=2917725 RepID=UPI001FA6D0BE|nr:hypothetical protein [Georgenia sp. TF02-10]UNX55071.1 hypothetical protein MF406_01940 [Georgenia sp. TF02-10]
MTRTESQDQAPHGAHGRLGDGADGRLGGPARPDGVTGPGGVARPTRVARFARWATVAVVAVEAVLLVAGRVDLGAAVAVLVAVELTLAAVVLTVGWRAARDHDGDRLGAAVRAVLPAPVAAVVLLEVGQLRALWLLLRGRTAAEGPADVPIPYAAGRGAIYLMVVAVCLIELLAVHLMVPWHRFGEWSWLRWLALALSAYAAGWVLAWWAAQRTHPHLLTADALVLRNGVIVALRVPLARVALVAPRRRGQGADGRLMLGGPGGGTNLDIELTGSVTWRSLTGRRERQVSAVSLEVDDAAAAATKIQAAITSGPPMGKRRLR